MDCFNRSFTPLCLTHRRQIRNYVKEFPLLAGMNALKQHFVEASLVTLFGTELIPTAWFPLMVADVS